MNRILIDLPEVIETPRLVLQVPKAGFGEKVHQAVIDGYEDCVRWLNWPSIAPTVEATEIDCRKHHAEFILRDCLRYLIIDRATDDVVGRCSYPPLQANWEVPRFGISYFIRKSKRSKGYGTIAAHALANLAFRVLKAQKVEIYSDAENISSARIPVKLGFQLEYTQKGGWPRQDGKLADVRTYSIFSEEELLNLEVSW